MGRARIDPVLVGRIFKDSHLALYADALTAADRLDPFTHLVCRIQKGRALFDAPPPTGWEEENVNLF